MTLFPSNASNNAISFAHWPLSKTNFAVIDKIMTVPLDEGELHKLIDDISFKNLRSREDLLQYACISCDLGRFEIVREILTIVFNDDWHVQNQGKSEILYVLSICINQFRKNLSFIVTAISEYDRSTAAALAFSIIRHEYDEKNLDVFYHLIIDVAESLLVEGRFAPAFDVIEPLIEKGKSLYLHSWIYRGALIEARIRFQLGLILDSERLIKEYQRSAVGHVSDVGPLLRLNSAALKSEDGSSDTQCTCDWVDLMDRIDFSRISQHYNPRPTLLKLKGARIISGSPGNSYFQFPISAAGEIYLDEFNIHPRYFVGIKDSPILSINKNNDVLVNFSGFNRSKVIYGKSILLGGAPNYYHWLFEYLPRLVSCKSLDPYDYIVVNPDFRAWQLELLQIIDPTCEEKLLSLNHGTLLEFEMLECPTLPQIDIAVEYLCQAFQSHPTIVPWRKLFISRRDAGVNRVRIEDEDKFYREVLRPNGFELIVLNGLSARSQIRLFSESSFVVGAHGAGLSNIVFCSQGTNIIEINNSANYTYTFFSEISRIKLHNFVRFKGEDISIAGSHPEDFPVQINYSDFMKLLLQLLSDH